LTQTVLQTIDLSKSYGDLKAVDKLNLEIYEGEVFGFLGPNGAGKTTSINMMCGLLKADLGQVLIKGEAVQHLRQSVGVCPQEIVLWGSLTCMEQMIFIGQMYGIRPREGRLRAGELLATLGLSEKENVQAHKLSGGMQRRLNLAMALVHDPAICILDEPEAGLDPQSRVAVRSYIKELAKHKTLILTTHNMDEAERLANRVAIIDHGKLLVLDTPEALRNSVGRGDVLEISLDGDRPHLEKALAALKDMQGIEDARLVNSTLQVRALDAANQMAKILNQLRNFDIQTGTVHIRQNSLEDVFIHLTGRRLRN